jgi:DNA-binding transcriptional LysR family regulator
MPRSSEHWQVRIGRRVRLRDLHVLLTVVQLGSMAKAAHRLRVSQPAISKAVADLEHALEVRLLDRGPQGVEATIYGHALVQRGTAVFDELRQGVSEIEFLANSAVGEVRVACHESLVAAFLPAVVSRLGEQYPGIAVRIDQMSMPISLEARRLRERNVDVIIARGNLDASAGDVQAEALFDESLIVVAGVHGPWVRKRKIALAELLTENWILFPPDEFLGQLLSQVFKDRGLALPRAHVYTMSYHLRDVLLGSGRYLTVIPECMLRVFNAKRPTVRRLPVDLGIKPRTVSLFSLKKRSLSPVAQLFVACAKDTARTSFTAGTR